MEERVSVRRAGAVMVRALLAAYVVTGLLLLLLAFLLFQFELDSGKTAVGVVVIYLLSCFVGGFLAGKRARGRRFLWGLAAGGAYYLILLAVSLATGGMQSAGGQGAAITALVVCVCSGMAGGMVA